MVGSAKPPPTLQTIPSDLPPCRHPRWRDCFSRVGGGFAEPTTSARWWVPQSLHPPYKLSLRIFRLVDIHGGVIVLVGCVEALRNPPLPHDGGFRKASTHPTNYPFR